jgi:hypothetical protein
MFGTPGSASGLLVTSRDPAPDPAPGPSIPSSSKNSKENLDLWLLYDFLSSKHDANVP